RKHAPQRTDDSKRTSNYGTADTRLRTRSMGSATETMESGQQATGNGKATNPSLADDVYQLAVPEGVATVLDRSPALGAGLNQQRAGARTQQQQTAATIEATPVVISLGNQPEASSSVAAGTANAEPGAPGAAPRDSSAAPQPAPKVTRLRPRRR